MKDGIHVFWLRDERKHPVTFVALKKDGNVVKYAIATRNPKDKFNRKVGLNKAMGRLCAVKTPAASFTLVEGDDPKKAVLMEIRKCLNNGVSARRSATLELLRMEIAAWGREASSEEEGS
jgi:hypothetical protein